MLIKTAIIKKLKSGKYRLYSKKKGKDGKRKNLGTFDSLEGAKKHEREVEYFKHKGDDANDDVSDDKETKILSKLSDIATYLEKAGFVDSAGKVYDAMDAIDGSLCEDYTLDTAGNPPDAQMNYLGSGYYEMTGEIGSGSQNTFSFPVAERVASKLTGLANKLDQSGNHDEADAIDDILKAIIEGYETDEEIKPDQRKLRRRKEKKKNEDALVGVNGLDETGATLNQFQGLTDSWFFGGYGNLGPAYK